MLLNHDVGFAFVKNLLQSKGFLIRSSSLKNKGRHCLVVCGENGSDKEYNFYIIYKREPFHSFSYLFKDFIHKFPNMSGFGESLNVEYLQLAKSKDCLILIVYENEHIYAVNSNYLYKFVHENLLVREQNRQNEYKEAYSNGQVNVIRERTASFPLKIMFRFE